MKRIFNILGKSLFITALTCGTWQAASAATPFPTTLTNTVSITVPTGWTDPDTSNNTAGNTTNVDHNVTLVVTKTDGVSIYTPGETGTYTIVVTNTGSSSAEDVKVTDILPTGLTANTVVTCVATGTSSCGLLSTDGQIGDTGFEFTDGRVSSGGTESLTFTLNVDYASNVTGAISNSVTVTDIESGETATTSDDVPNAFTPISNLSATKNVVGGVTDYVPGGTLSYELVFMNAGPSDVTAAEILDNLPTGVTLSGTWTCAADTLGSICNAASGGTTGDASVSLTADIIKGGTVTVTVPVGFDANSSSY